MFSGAVVTLFVLLLALLRPQGPLVREHLQKRGAWIYRLRYLWYPLLVSAPITLIVLAWLGYFYAAEYLYQRLLATLLLGLGCHFVGALLVRWLKVTQQRSVIEERRREKAEAKEKAAHGTVPTANPVQNEPAHEEQLATLSQQTHRLINAATTLFLVVGIWWIWKSVLPALEVLDRIALWHITDAQGGDIAISLGALLLSVAIGAITVIVARNAPGLLEIVILQRLPLDRGTRFAITTLCRYVLVVFGVVLAFSTIQIGWSKVQWLVAAMTVGLGFGLETYISIRHDINCAIDAAFRRATIEIAFPQRDVHVRSAELTTPLSIKSDA